MNLSTIIDIPIDIKNTVKTLHLSSTLIKNIARTSHILLVIILNTVKTSIRIIIIINIPDQPSGEASNNHIKMIIIITKNNHKYSRSAFWRSTRESLLKNVAKRGISYFLWCRFILVKVKAMMEMFFEFLVCFISWSFFAYPWWCHQKFFSFQERLDDQNLNWGSKNGTWTRWIKCWMTRFKSLWNAYYYKNIDEIYLIGFYLVRIGLDQNYFQWR